MIVKVPRPRLESALLDLRDIDVEVAIFDGWELVVVDVSIQDDTIPVLGDEHSADDVEIFRSDAADGDDPQLRQAADEVVDVAVSRPV